MFALVVFVLIFVTIRSADQSSCAAGRYHIRMDQCSRLFNNTTTSVPYREQFFVRMQLQQYKPLITSHLSDYETEMILPYNIIVEESIKFLILGKCPRNQI